jgi:hypothetical protein
VFTNASGVFSFPLDRELIGGCHYSTLPGGGWTVACSVGDPKTTQFVVSSPSGSPMRVYPSVSRDWNAEEPVILWRKAVLRGVWLDADGRPCAGRDLALDGPRVLPWTCLAALDGLKARTDEKGNFVFDGVAARVHWTLAIARSEKELGDLAPIEIVLKPGEVRDLALQSPLVRTVSGMIRDSSGHPRAHAAVWLDGPSGSRTTRSADDGSFRLEGVRLGSWSARAFFPCEYKSVEEGIARRLEIETGDGEYRLDLLTLPVASIRGRIVDPLHLPCDTCEVCFDSETSSVSGVVARAEKDGSFVMPQLFTGDYRIVATDERHFRSSPIRTVRTDSTDLELVLESGGTLSGRAPTSEGQVTVDLERIDPREENQSSARKESSLSEEFEAASAFSFGGLPRGTWSVQARSRDLVSAIRYVQVVVGKDTPCPDLALAPAAELLLIAPPESGDVEVEVRSAVDLLARVKLVGEVVEHRSVPAGDIRVVARRAGVTSEDRTLKAERGRTQLVAVGFGH